ncbi:hypothetical protein METBIDRAFT_12723 [Metschnikowia bicuspidata var. bicuspidata NRRL YB-4993]|uniref:Uncharacterized protein n=1 Tax=Metschnikowia bicuspidata var. bicuspidata NRRL YB-4993 TaxID=869754 RepID=A0A1A0HA82_9ASCO|nr:hypothetical protein METBIDRAFT_12723 [Metschnikowia bicuspidata var. bicuspidata NRRL YB-4993]OBA20783.1 hypothetical protein METBIDRAFT_12723 [Metschnikowia bicuspidata var. bicuspidata NRRL YB-4993]
MKIFSVLPLLSLAFASTPAEDGEVALTICDLHSNSKDIYVYIKSDGSVTESVGALLYELKNNLVFEGGRYLVLTNNKLAMAYESDHSVYIYETTLRHGSGPVFELCGDGLIGVESGCAGAESILISTNN